jgi:hypothetical protein
MSEVNDSGRKCRHSPLTGGIILTGIGLVFLLSNFRIIPHIGRSWPLILIVIGVALLAGALGHRRDSNSAPTPPPVG